MKTLADFGRATLKRASQIRTSLGNDQDSPEKTSKALVKELKLTENKLTYLLKTLELIGNQIDRIQKVIVYSLGETESAPARTYLEDVIKVENSYYSLRMVPPAPRKKLNPENPEDLQTIVNRKPSHVLGMNASELLTANPNKLLLKPTSDGLYRAQPNSDEDWLIVQGWIVDIVSEAGLYDLSYAFELEGRIFVHTYSSNAMRCMLRRRTWPGSVRLPLRAL